MGNAPFHGQSGLTLVEVIVSLVLVGLISLAGLLLVDSLISVQLRVDDRYIDLSDLQRTFEAFELDTQQADPGAISLEPASLVLQTHACGAVGYVEFRLGETGLQRTATQCGGTEMLLGDGASSRIEVIDTVGRNWSVWPANIDDDDVSAQAIELIVNLNDREGRLTGEMRRIVNLPARIER